MTGINFSSELTADSISVAYLDAGCRYRFVNDIYCRNQNLNEDQIIGQHIKDVLPKEVFKGIEEYVDAALNGEHLNFEYRHGDTDSLDSRIYKASYIPDHDADGNVRGFFAFVNIQSESDETNHYKRFRHAVDQAVEGFAIHDKDGKFTYINNAQAEMYGYTSEELLGQHWHIFYDDEQIQQIESEYFPLLLKEQKWSGEVTGTRKDGKKVDISLSLSLLNDGDGNPAGLVCNCQDVTNRKIEEQTLRQLQKIDALGQLTGGIAHDINNLLSIIIGSVDLLLEPDKETSQNTHLERALSAANRVSALVNRLLSFSRKQPLHPKTIDVSESIAEMLDLVHRTLGENIRVEADLSDDVWLCEVDPSALENAVLNLALNARDAMPTGGNLQFSTYNVAAKQPTGNSCLLTDHVCIAVSDTGTGMPTEVQEKMFDPFYTTKEFGKGNGLGLSMVHGFVRQSKGQISVDSKLGTGTDIKIFLPKSNLTSVINQDNNNRDAEIIPEKSNREAIKILVVEDNPGVLKTTIEMLDDIGYSTLQAEQAEEALALLAKNKEIDLILSDVVLKGGMSGPEMMTNLPHHHKDTKILFMSGYKAGHFVSDKLENYLDKPFTRDDLAIKIAETLE